MTELKHKIILYVTIVVLSVALFTQRSCSAQTTIKQKVVVPEKKGEFENPVSIVNEKGKKDSITWKDKIIKTENPINKKLAEDFILSQKENDSLKSLKLYLNAIEERESEYIFDNKDLKLEIRTKTRGEVNLGVQNKKGDLLLLKYGVTDKSIGLSYIHRFINIKR